MTDSNRCTADLDRSSLSGWSGSHRAFDGNLGVAVNTCKSPVVGTTSALGLAWGAVPRGNGSSAAWAAAPCTCRIAFGPRAGQKVFFTVQGAMPRDAARDQDLCADHLATCSCAASTPPRNATSASTPWCRPTIRW